MRTESSFRQGVRAGYLAGLPVADIAKQLGSTVGSVKVTACQMGISDDPATAAWKRYQRRRQRRAGAKA